jgi:hypothetical protein
LRPNEAKATAHLPGLDIEIVHHRAEGADAERISIHMQAVPSFEAFGRYLEAASPFAFWAQATRLAWLPWLAAASLAMQPFAPAPRLPTADAPTLSPQEQPLPE